jgi:hypothetical protein
MLSAVPGGLRTRRYGMGGADADAGRLPPWPGGAAWIDGRYCRIEDAKISVLDLGLTRYDERN